MDKEHVAYHEAGHAVIALILGYEPYFVNAISNKNAAGRTKIKNRPLSKLRKSGLEPSYIDPDGHQGARAMQLVGHAIMINLAGALAQKRYDPQSDWEWGATGAEPDEIMQPGADDRLILELLDALFGETKVAGAYRAFLEARTETLVEEHWPRIERLAHVLIEHGSLNGSEEIKAAQADPAKWSAAVAASEDRAAGVE
jgi:hypothetical protein